MKFSELLFMPLDIEFFVTWAILENPLRLRKNFLVYDQNNQEQYSAFKKLDAAKLFMENEKIERIRVSNLVICRSFGSKMRQILIDSLRLSSVLH